MLAILKLILQEASGAAEKLVEIGSVGIKHGTRQEILRFLKFVDVFPSGAVEDSVRFFSAGYFQTIQQQ